MRAILVSRVSQERKAAEEWVYSATTYPSFVLEG